jgi:hypothetical protein
MKAHMPMVLFMAGAMLLLSGCATTSVTPTFPASRGLPQPDRVIVYDFAVTPEDIDLDPGVASATGSIGAVAQNLP